VSPLLALCVLPLPVRFRGEAAMDVASHIHMQPSHTAITSDFCSSRNKNCCDPLSLIVRVHAGIEDEGMDADIPCDIYKPDQPGPGLCHDLPFFCVRLLV
jgi:hypothetical protein